MTMFKRSKGTNLNRGAERGATSWPPPMPDDVYQRNGIAPRPAPAIDREYAVHYGNTRPRSDYHRPHNHASNYSRGQPYANSSPTMRRFPMTPPAPARPAARPAAARPAAPNQRIGGSSNVAPASNNLADPPDSRPPLHSMNHISHPADVRRYGSTQDAADAGPSPTPTSLTPQHNNNIDGSGNENPSTTIDNDTPQRTSGSRRFLQTINPVRLSMKRNSKKKNNPPTKIMRVYVQPQMLPDNSIRVLCPDQTIKIATIPPPTKWVTEYAGNGSQQIFFRVEFDPSKPTLSIAPVPASAQSANQSNTSSCNCVPRLGVFDSMCSEHGPPGPPSIPSHSNHQQGLEQNVQETQQDDMSDVISVAHEEGGGVPGAFASFDTSVTRKGLGWECKACGLINDLELDACAVCYVVRHGMGEFGVRERELEPATLQLR